MLSALLAVSHRSKTQQSLPTMESDTAPYCGPDNHQHTLMYTVRYCMVASKDGSQNKCLDPHPPLLLSSALGQSATRCNKVIKTPAGEEKMETKHQTFINDCLSLSAIFHVFDWLNLVYLLDTCIFSGIPSQNCCRECVMMPKLMTRTQYC